MSEQIAQTPRHGGGMMAAMRAMARGNGAAMPPGHHMGGASAGGSWVARTGVDPLYDAFDEGIVTHPGMGAMPVDPSETASLLEGLSRRERRARTVAYFNIPYCETRCLYCMFYISPYRNKEESGRFADALIREMRLWEDRAIQQGRPLEAVYFGGGTPTALEADDIRRVLKAARTHLPLANDCEITFEGRLSNFGPDRIEACLDGGVNRFSMGVQSFDTRIRQAMGRRSGREELIKSLERLLGYHQAAVVIDLIYGFPYQNLETWKEDLTLAGQIGVDGVDCYQLRVFPGSPLSKVIAAGKIPQGPGHRERADMFAHAVKALAAPHWRRLSISHWARNTRERNFYNYYVKGRSDCLPFGPGAGGSIFGHSLMNSRSVGDWMEAVNSGRRLVAMMTRPRPNHQAGLALSEQLELNYLNVEILEREVPGAGFAKRLEPILSNWEEAGLLERHGPDFLLTTAGQFWQGRLAQCLMDALSR